MSDTNTVTYGRFTWYDMINGDEAGAIDFYTKLFGWQIEDMDMGPAGVYKTWSDGKEPRGGFMNKPAPDVPAHWVGYVSVENIEETVNRVENNGGKLLCPVMDIPDVGKIAPFMDPTGGAIAAYQSNNPTAVAANFMPPRLTVCWNELLTNDVPAATAFYSEVFGWRSKVNEMPGFKYTVFFSGEMQVAGLMPAPPDMGGQSSWLSHVYVDNLTETLNKAKELEAKIIMPPRTMPNIGSFFLLQDPQGAHIFAFEPTKEMKEADC
jgi:uncharacterized protein